MPVDSCLGNDTLVDLVEGRADRATRERAVAHAASCEACRVLMSALARDVTGAVAPGEHADTVPAGLPDDDELPSGAPIGRYVVVRRLGAGGMGVVYAARDPELDRTVAVKLLRVGAGGSRPAMEERLRREAQAMAQLAHPNVVAIHDVGNHDSRIYIAMEYVDGDTLAHWLAGERRETRAILDAFLAAGSGLSAAHAAGLVHRDFKPENVLVGTDGRVRVGDFGLARAAGIDPASGGDLRISPDGPTSPAELTATGAVLGTPFYMAPEQARGEQVDARSDQFSFCVALYRALYDVRPFAGDDVASLCASIDAGRLAVPLTARRLRRSTASAIRRGLAAKPEDRFATLDELLARLARSSRRGRWIVPAVAAAAVTAAIAIVARPVASPCRDAASHLGGVWDSLRKSQIATALAATGVPFATASYREVARVGDAYATSWVAMHDDACEATRVRGEQTEDALGLRMSCLDGRLRELAALGEQLAHADGALAEGAVRAAHALSSIDACADLQALSAPLPPADPVMRARSEDLRARLAEVRGLRDAGRSADALAKVAPLVDEARVLAYRPVEAEALALAGMLASDSSADALAEARLHDAALAAEAGRHDVVLAEVLVQLVSTVGFRRARFADAEPLEERARAAIERLGAAPDLEARLHYSIGTVESASGKIVDAERDYEAAIALIERHHGADDLALVGPLRALGAALLKQERPDRALPLLERALAIVRRAFSDDHPEVAAVLEAIGGAQYMAGDYASAAANYRRALEVVERAYGPESTRVAQVLGNIASVDEFQGEPNAALSLRQRAVAIEERTLGPNHPVTLTHSQQLASLLDELGRDTEALAILDRVLPLQRQQLGPDHPEIAETLDAISFVQLARHDYAAALAAAREAYGMEQRTLGASYRPIAEPRAIGDALLGLGRAGDAIAPLEEAARNSAGGDPASVAWADGLLGRALVDSGRDPARGKKLVASAWRYLASDERAGDQRAHLEAWMKARGLSVP